MGEKKQKINSKKLMILIIFLVVIIVAIIGIVKGISSFLEDKNMENSNLSGDNQNGIEQVESNIDNISSKGVAIPGWSSITIPADTTQVSVNFMNPEQNKDLYYLTFELRLLNDSEEGYEVLYKSELIEPGKQIESIELSKSLTAGEYDSIVHVQPYRMDDAKTPTNNADMKTKLIVK